MARVLISAAAAGQIDGLPLAIQIRIKGVVERLAAWPNVSGAKPLRGDLKGHFRVRTGDYRVQFQVRGDLVVIEKVGHRDGFYEE